MNRIKSTKNRSKKTQKLKHKNSSNKQKDTHNVFNDFTSNRKDLNENENDDEVSSNNSFVNDLMISNFHSDLGVDLNIEIEGSLNEVEDIDSEKSENYDSNYLRIISDSLHRKSFHQIESQSDEANSDENLNDISEMLNALSPNRRNNSLAVNNNNRNSNSNDNNNSVRSSDNLMPLLAKLNNELIEQRLNSQKLRNNLEESLAQKNEIFALLKKCQSERDHLNNELTSLKYSKDNDFKRTKAQLDYLSKEYHQVMSERDVVHKEIEALQEKLAKTESQLRHFNVSFQNNAASSLPNSARSQHKNESMNNYARQSLIMHDHEKLNETLEELEIDSLKNQIRIISRQRDEALIKIDELYSGFGMQTVDLNIESKSNNDKTMLSSHQPASIDSSNHDSPDESTNLMKDSAYSNFKLVEENDSLKLELNNLAKELNQAKKRRDWAFIERDRILKERESIRALCDEMRNQRDNAISELAESLRESDELRKQKTVAYKQISHLEDKCAYFEEKLMMIREQEEIEMAAAAEERDLRENEQAMDEKKNDIKHEKCAENKSKSHLNLNHSGNHRIVKVDLKIKKDGNLGAEFSYATVDEHETKKDESLNEESEQADKNERQLNRENETEENSSDSDRSSKNMAVIIVNSIHEDSSASGKLKVNDRVLKINNTDLMHIDSEMFQLLISNLEGSCTFVVSRFYKDNDSTTNSNKTTNKSLNSSQSYTNIKSASSVSSSGHSLDARSKSSSFNELKKLNNNLHDTSASKNVDYVGDYLRKSLKCGKITYQSNISQEEEDDEDEERETNDNFITISLESLSYIVLEKGVFVAGLKEVDSDRSRSNSQTTSSRGQVSIGDRVLAINGFNLMNKSLRDINPFLKNYKNFKLVIQKARKLSNTRLSHSHKYLLARDESRRSVCANQNQLKVRSFSNGSLNKSDNSIYSDLITHINTKAINQNGAESHHVYKHSPRANTTVLNYRFSYPTQACTSHGNQMNSHHDEQNDDDLIRNYQEHNHKEKVLYFDRNVEMNDAHANIGNESFGLQSQNIGTDRNKRNLDMKIYL